MQIPGVTCGASGTSCGARMASTKRSEIKFWTENLSQERASLARDASRRKLASHGTSTDARDASEEWPLGFPELNARSQLEEGLTRGTSESQLGLFHAPYLKLFVSFSLIFHPFHDPTHTHLILFFWAFPLPWCKIFEANHLHTFCCLVFITFYSSKCGFCYFLFRIFLDL